MSFGIEDTKHVNRRQQLAKNLVEIAILNDLCFIDKNQYKDTDGNRLTQTPLGYVSTEQYNIHLEYSKLMERYQELQVTLDAMKSEKKNLVVYNKSLDDKTLLKVVKILQSNISDTEKCAELIKYLNV